MKIIKSLSLAIILVSVMGFNLMASPPSVLNTPAAQGLSSEPPGETDHSLVTGSVGMQTLFIQNLGKEKVNDVECSYDLDIIGIRYWITEKIGLDLGLALYMHKMEDEDMQFGFGLMAGVPFAISAYKHLTLYIEPQLDFGIFHVRKEVTPWTFGLAGYGGAELSMGWLGIPRLSFLAKIGIGLRASNNGDKTDFTLAAAPDLLAICWPM
jgi:hypothetical protein